MLALVYISEPRLKDSPEYQSVDIYSINAYKSIRRLSSCDGNRLISMMEKLFMPLKTEVREVKWRCWFRIAILRILEVLALKKKVGYTITNGKER